MFVELENVAALDQHHIADRAVHRARHLGMQLQLPVLAVDGNEIFRLHQIDDQLQFFLAGVPADVDRRRSPVFIDHVRLAAEQVIDHAVDRLLVAGNDARREHDRVALLDLGVLVVVHGRARQRRHGFALGSADHHAHFFRREILHLAGIDHEPIGNLEVAQIFGDLRRVVHRAADESHFAPVLLSQFHRQADAVNGRRKAGNKQPPLGMREHFVKLPPHRALTGRVALAFNVGRILKQRQHALFSVFGEGVQIKKMVIGGRGIDLEVAGMNDHAQRRVNRERDAIHQTVRHPNGMNGECTDLKALASTNLAQVGIFEQPVLVKFVFHVGQRELGAPDRHVKLGENPGQSADVIFVAVSEHDPAHPLPVFDEIGNIGNHDVHAEQFSLGEHQPGVDHNNVIAPAHGHAVHTELAEAAEGHNLQFSSWH